MIQKIIASIEVWIGLGFFIVLLGYVPVVGSAVGGILGSIISIAAQIPFYSIIIAVLGTILFFDGIIKLFHH
ncbi:MAG: hypothetical protein UU24_C0039G0009 [Candidatus Nomurabacteria bacterium GW2011_GWA2_40_9]|uniref:Uncharacterized protein n=1 Tax=Candidatus Nomurabacteria bacterium GW2011_GWA2_40_9 TaxID=1618734 RepID=A0A0G0TU77_9BACT|nr:MAG: hypothetical protein UU24_C0039G0009 [Candidatus Nomurabacteria bacterium GW2011_GWA2_40_9]